MIRETLPHWVLIAWKRGTWDTIDIANHFQIAEHEAYNLLARMRKQTHDTADPATVKLQHQGWESDQDGKPKAFGVRSDQAETLKARARQ